MHSECRAVIFDLDGTLVDSLLDIATLMNETLAAHALPTHAIDAYRAFVGSGITALAERATAGLDVDVAQLAAEFRSRYRAEPVRHTRPYEGIDAMLTTLREARLTLAILSNKPDELTQLIVRELFEEGLFGEVLGHREAHPRKPDPTTALALAGRLGVSPSACVFVGDTPIDMQTAARSGMRGIGVAWGFRPRATLEAAGAATVIDRAAELPSLVV